MSTVAPDSLSGEGGVRNDAAQFHLADTSTTAPVSSPNFRQQFVVGKAAGGWPSGGVTF